MFFIEGKTDPMERQVIIMYTLTIKQINLSFALNVRTLKKYAWGGIVKTNFYDQTYK